MDGRDPSMQIVYTNEARCRDCYRCVRVCPVKAIRMEDDQAYVEDDRCINCGTCIRECPQEAKTYRNDLDFARELIGGQAPVAISLAPSFAAVFNQWEQKRLPSALRLLGFNFIAETATGAYFTAQDSASVVKAHPSSSHVFTACPAVVSYIQKYRHDCVEALSPVVSPMIAHSRLLKKQLGENAKVIFIGPCVAKKDEAQWPQNAGAVDCVLTFTELRDWLEAENIVLRDCEDSTFDDAPAGASRFFPLAGGSLRTGNMVTDLLDAKVVSVSGFDEFVHSLDRVANGNQISNTGPIVVEPLFCQQGCINGPAMFGPDNMFTRRQGVIDYADTPVDQTLANKTRPETGITFRQIETPGTTEVSDEEIVQVLGQTGKAELENQLNCGACGYMSCHAQASAVVQGMAEPDMCLPYMRRLAEQRTDHIIDTSPNGIVILDQKLRILNMNPAFQKMFQCSPATCGKQISILMDPDIFENLIESENTAPVTQVIEHKNYDLICHQIVYALPDDGQYVGIFVNITKTRASQQKLNSLRELTIKQAQELLEHQTQMAQKMAELLGQSAAQGEDLVDKLVTLANEESASKNQELPNCPKDIFTST